MQITDVRIRVVNSEREVKLKAYADVTFNDSFVIHGLKVIDGQKGMFVAMPSRKMPNGEYKDIAHPITQGLRKELTDTVIVKYQETSSLDPGEFVLNTTESEEIVEEGTLVSD